MSSRDNKKNLVIPPRMAGESGNVTPTDGAGAVSNNQRMNQLEQRLTELMQQNTALINQNQQLQMAPMAAAQNPQQAQVKSIMVTEFSGPTTTMSVELWISNLERQQAALAATDAQMLNAALCSLRGVAGKWREEKEASGATCINTLADFKAAMLKRFGKDRTPTDLLALLKNLAQTQDEPVRDFADRISLNLQIMSKSLKTKLPNIPPQEETANSRELARVKTAARDNGFNLAFNHLKAMFFISGLQPELRTRVEPKFATTEDLDTLVEHACEFERVLAKNKTNLASITSQSDPEVAKLVAEINSLKARFNNNLSKDNKGTPPQQQQKGKLTGKAKLADRIKKVNRHKFCTNCKQWGKHIATECRYTKTQLASLSAMDPAEQPEGEPKDAFWDNWTPQDSGN